MRANFGSILTVPNRCHCATHILGNLFQWTQSLNSSPGCEEIGTPYSLGMKAAIFDQFGEVPTIREVPDPTPGDHSIVIDVKANGICRSDWHAWIGHDSTVQLPHVPGHEMAGVVSAIGREVGSVEVGDRVTVPFACGCGSCRYCKKGQLHICNDDFQPGFTHWGSFAEKVEIHYADHNVVKLPANLDFKTAASLGCRFATAWRAVLQQAKVSKDDWLAVHGCGGLGLSAILIAKAHGARVVAVDIDQTKLDFAQSIGADEVIDASKVEKVPKRIMQITDGGVDASIDALGSKETSVNSVKSLRKQGRHVQSGLLLGDQAQPDVPMGRVIAFELEILGSHGMSALDYPEMLEFVAAGKIDPNRLVGRSIPLSESPKVLAAMNQFNAIGMTVIEDFAN